MEIIKNIFKDPELEKRVLAYIIRKDPTKRFLLKSHYFSVLPLRNLFEYLKNSKSSIKDKTVLLHLIHKQNYLEYNKDIFGTFLSQIYKVRLKTFSFDSYKESCGKLQDYYKSRFIVRKIKKVLTSINEQTFDIDEAKKALREAYSVTVSEDTSLVPDYVVNYKTRLKIVKTRERDRVSDSSEKGGNVIITGIDKFDSLTGGLIKGEFGVVSGITGIGKTNFLIALAAEAWLNGFNVLFVTGEMSKEEIEFRFDSLFNSIPFSRFRLGKLKKKDYEKWRKEIDKFSIMYNQYLEVIEFPRRFNVAMVDDMIELFEETKETKLDVAFIDHLNIMSSASAPKSFSTRDWQAQAEVVWDVKELAAERKIVAWTAGQLTTEGMKKEQLELGDLKYARAIDETAPVVVGLVQTQDDVLEGVMQLQILKLRSAELPSAPILLHPNLKIMKIHERYRKVGDLLKDVEIGVEDTRSKGRKGKELR